MCTHVHTYSFSCGLLVTVPFHTSVAMVKKCPASTCISRTSSVGTAANRSNRLTMIQELEDEQRRVIDTERQERFIQLHYYRIFVYINFSSLA